MGAPVLTLGHNGQVGQVADYQAGSIEVVFPVVVFSGFGSVTGGITENNQFRIQNDAGIRRQGLQEFIGGFYVDFRLLSGGNRLRYGRSWCGLFLGLVFKHHRLSSSIHCGETIRAVPIAKFIVSVFHFLQYHTFGLEIVNGAGDLHTVQTALLQSDICAALNQEYILDIAIGNAAPGNCYSGVAPDTENLLHRLVAAEAVKLGAGDGDILVAAELDGSQGTFIDFAIRNRYILRLEGHYTQGSAAVQTQSLQSHIFAGPQTHHAAFA